jgi:predicted dehydrogenase
MDAVVLGLGRMGQTHIKALQNLEHDLVGIFDINPDAISQISQQYNPDVYRATSVDDLLENTQAEIAIIATTAPSHFEIVMKVLISGIKFVICEKPFACSISEAEAMLIEARSRGALLSVNHQRRFMDSYKTVKSFIEDNRLGQFRSMNVSASNIGLSMNGIHYLEIFTWLTNQDIEQVAAWLDNEPLSNPRGKEFIDFSGQILAKTQNGHRLYIDVGNDLGNGIFITLGFTYGKVIINEISGEMQIWGRETEYIGRSTLDYALPSKLETISFEQSDLVQLTMAVISSVITDNGFPTGFSGTNALRSVIAAIESSENESSQVVLDELATPQRHFNWA